MLQTYRDKYNFDAAFNAMYVCEKMVTCGSSHWLKWQGLRTRKKTGMNQVVMETGYHPSADHGV